MMAIRKMHTNVISGAKMTMIMLVASPLSLSADVKADHQASPEIKTKKLLRPSELPIYDMHACHCGHKQSHQAIDSSGVSTALQSEIRRARELVVGSFDALTDTKDRAVHFFETGKAHTLDTVAYLREESNLLSRAGAISVGGLTGLLLAARRGFFKKLIYSGSGMAAIASVCYPTEASQISKGAFTIVKYYAYVGYQRLDAEVRARSSALSSSSKVEAPKSAKNADASFVQTKKDKKESGGDFGQSHPEDKDLYTTRSS